MTSQDKGSKGGFPIRRSLDQSSFAAPQGLSQRTTSFIASQRQGIHQMLLRHLITLMIDVRSAKTGQRSKKDLPSTFRSKTLLAEYIRRTRLRAAAGSQGLGRPACRMYSLFTMSNIRAALSRAQHEALQTFRTQTNWWSQTGSNRRPPECKSGALPAELWPRVGIDLTIMVGLGRLERPTSPLSGVRSNHLSYRP